MTLRRSWRGKSVKDDADQCRHDRCQNCQEWQGPISEATVYRLQNTENILGVMPAEPASELHPARFGYDQNDDEWDNKPTQCVNTLPGDVWLPPNA